MLVYHVGGDQGRHVRIREHRPRIASDRADRLVRFRLVKGGCIRLYLNECGSRYRKWYLPLGVRGYGHQPCTMGLRVLVEGRAAGGKVIGRRGTQKLEWGWWEGRKKDVG